MKTSPKYTLLGAAALLAACFALPVQAQRSSGSLSDQVRRLEYQSDQFRDEVAAHYRGSGAYRFLMDYANQIDRKVNHLEDLADAGRGARDMIRVDLVDLDGLVDRIHRVLDALDRGSYGRGHGSSEHLHEVVVAMSSTINRMQEITNGPGSGHGRGRGDFNRDWDRR